MAPYPAPMGRLSRINATGWWVGKAALQEQRSPHPMGADVSRAHISHHLPLIYGCLGVYDAQREGKIIPLRG